MLLLNNISNYQKRDGSLGALLFFASHADSNQAAEWTTIILLAVWYQQLIDLHSENHTSSISFLRPTVLLRISGFPIYSNCWFSPMGNSPRIRIGFRLPTVPLRCLQRGKPPRRPRFPPIKKGMVWHHGVADSWGKGGSLEELKMYSCR